MFKTMKVNRNFVEWLAEILPEYQHEDVSPLGDNINECLDSNARNFVVMFKSAACLKSYNIDLNNLKLLLRAYFHNLILVKIVPQGVKKLDQSA